MHVQGVVRVRLFPTYQPPFNINSINVNSEFLLCYDDISNKSSNVYKKASIRWQDSARRQFQAGLIGDVGL